MNLLDPRRQNRNQASIHAAMAILFGHGDKKTPVALPIPPKGSPKGPKVGRNDPCPCKSGKKFKKCCSPKQDEILAAMKRGELVHDPETGLMKPAV